MELTVSQSSRSDGTRRTARLSRLPRIGDVEIFFDMLDAELPPPTVLDGFVLAVLLPAMSAGEPLHVAGPVTREGLANIHELMEIWSRWRPKRYRIVPITCDEIVEKVPHSPPDTLVAFSGGVDSVFTLLRHARLLPRGAARKPAAALMVHGFDVPLADPQAFERLKARTQPFIDEIGIPLLTVRTNLKQLDLQAWEDGCMLQLVAAMHNWSHRYRYALVGSTEPYEALVLPWGSSPVTDHLMSSDAMRIVHDGAGSTRTEKVAVIASDPIAQRILKVCWEGNDAAGNCGICEKCIRTQLNFLAAGTERPTCFPGPLDLPAIDTIRLEKALHANELVGIVRHAREHGATGPWLDRLEARLAAFKPPSAAAAFLTKLRRLFALLAEGDVRQFVTRIKRHLPR